jgi:hypothetical protein
MELPHKHHSSFGGGQSHCRTHRTCLADGPKFWARNLAGHPLKCACDSASVESPKSTSWFGLSRQILSLPTPQRAPLGEPTLRSCLPTEWPRSAIKRQFPLRSSIVMVDLVQRRPRIRWASPLHPTHLNWTPRMVRAESCFCLVTALANGIVQLHRTPIWHIRPLSLCLRLPRCRIHKSRQLPCRKKSDVAALA